MKIEINGTVLAAAVLAAPVAVVGVLHRYAKRHQGTEEEVTGTFPGDDLVPESPGIATRAITIDAPPEKVWPLINQIGQHKAGFYSFSGFERMAHFLIHNTYTPQARWQDTAPGDWIFYGQQGIGSQIVEHVPQEYFTMLSDSRRPPTADGAIAWVPPGWEEYAWTWNFHLRRLPDGRTRLISRTGGWGRLGDRHPRLGTFINTYVWGWSGTVMTTRMLEVIRACAEGKRFIHT